MEGEDSTEKSQSTTVRRERTADEDCFSTGIEILEKFIEFCFGDFRLPAGCIHASNVDDYSVDRWR